MRHYFMRLERRTCTVLGGSPTVNKLARIFVGAETVSGTQCALKGFMAVVFGVQSKCKHPTSF